ncbi:choline ABC transporter substrate-binding protein [Methylobacterium pseudosasicola]|uniref:Glycine betaine/proline transport system substrate-binding protein n=1 Tax=Methylobacterium pseudosasicola TaxID=582667 RepID=A0A1I4GVY6_9HYPH|nr:choline ABC transporter substrate-binding protein [Methylobacterium pseudosasicola]SFL34099.1 glycine betaine/proline transport system substrate-binding protein [Methylobacterium pseudosasicola]
MCTCATRLLLGVTLGIASCVGAAAADPASCKTVRFADVGWTDIAATTALASRILSGLGYAPKTQTLSVPVTYASLGAKNVDVFLGNWMPTMEADRKPYLDKHAIEVLGPNLTGAKYTFAVPAYLYEAGLKSFSDIAKFRRELKGKIYGIEPGNDGNRTILTIINDNTYNLSSFDLVESSEQGMLAQVDRAIQRKEPILFLGWEPHPMNTKFPIRYLSGGDDTFGPNYGGAEIFTNLRAGYAAECPNLGRFFKNLTFDLQIENVVMSSILFDGLEPDKAADKWLKANPDAWKPWLAGVETLDGKPALPAEQASLK